MRPRRLRLITETHVLVEDPLVVQLAGNHVEIEVHALPGSPR